MISKSKAKYIFSLQKKKVRDEAMLFVVEGDKLVKEYLSAKIPIKLLVANHKFLSTLATGLTSFVNEIEEVSDKELNHISALKTPQNALAVVPIPDNRINLPAALEHLCVALDVVQDPGNLGTIIRAAGWFGIRNIICSNDCADVYNPKVIQASMGALLHVNVYYSDLKEVLIRANKGDVPVYGTMLEGDSIYDHNLSRNGVILLGNESKGISEELIPFITERIMIPSFNTSRRGIDSLNVGMAASVVFSEFQRKSVTLI